MKLQFEMVASVETPQDLVDCLRQLTDETQRAVNEFELSPIRKVSLGSETVGSFAVWPEGDEIMDVYLVRVCGSYGGAWAIDPDFETALLEACQSIGIRKAPKAKQITVYCGPKEPAFMVDDFGSIHYTERHRKLTDAQVESLLSELNPSVLLAKLRKEDIICRVLDEITDNQFDAVCRSVGLTDYDAGVVNEILYS